MLNKTGVMEYNLALSSSQYNNKICMVPSIIPYATVVRGSLSSYEIYTSDFILNNLYNLIHGGVWKNVLGFQD